jgi:hypothetical protein
MRCILCGETGRRSMLTFPCDEHYICKPCVDSPEQPYTDADILRFVRNDANVHWLARQGK